MKELAFNKGFINLRFYSLIFTLIFSYALTVKSAWALPSALMTCLCFLSAHEREKKQHQQDIDDVARTMDKNKEAICREIRKAAGNTESPPNLDDFNRIAGHYGKTGPELQAWLEKQPGMGLGLKALFTQDYERAYEILSKIAKDREQKIRKPSKETAEAWFYAASAAYFNREYKKAVEACAQAVKHKPDYAEAWSNWGVALSRMEKYNDACQKYTQAAKHKPDFANVWYNWGISLDKMERYKDACQKYAEAVKHKPNFFEAWYNWGKILVKLKNYKEAAKKFEKTVKHKPDFALAWSNWGTALNRMEKFDEACQKHAEAVKLKPTLGEAWNNWGAALGNIGEHKEAAEKFAEAIKLKPDHAKAWSNGGFALLEMSKTENGEDAVALLDQARKKFEKAEDLQPGIGAYVLACISAIEGEINECRMWLEKTKDAGKLKGEHLKKDKALDAVRNEPWFKKFMDKEYP